jgi:RNA polymerase sigma-70 factor (ECF subfamily)
LIGGGTWLLCAWEPRSSGGVSVRAAPSAREPQKWLTRAEGHPHPARPPAPRRPFAALRSCTLESEPISRLVDTGRRITPTPSRITLVTPLTFVGDDAALVEALRAGHPGAVAALYDRYAAPVRLTLRSILGPDDEIPDLLQEVFIRALDRIGKLREVDRLGSWLTTMAVFVGRAQIRVRSRRRWLRVFSPERTRPRQLEQPSSDARRAMREIYAVLDGMPVDQRMAFVLRHFHGARLAEAAEACETSLATVKRRLAQAEARFLEAVRRQPGLAQWLEEGTRWTEKKA